MNQSGRCTLYCLVVILWLAFWQMPGVYAEKAIGDRERLLGYREWSKTYQGKNFLELVRETVTSLVNGQSVSISGDRDFPWIHYPVGIFVTAMQNRKVRVCVGGFTPTEATLSRELIRQCKRLIIEDPRHDPLNPDEMGRLRFVVTFTGNPIPIADAEQVDIWEDGLLMRWNGREAVLLPGEAKTLVWGLKELKRQIQIPKNENPSYASFPVVILQETHEFLKSLNHSPCPSIP